MSAWNSLKYEEDDRQKVNLTYQLYNLCYYAILDSSQGSIRKLFDT